MKPASQAAPGGIAGDTLRALGSFVRHIQALGALAGAESREALSLYIRLLIMLGAAVLFAAIGYVFGIVFLAFAVAAVFGIAWVWIALTLAALHLVMAGWCAVHVRDHYRTPVFAITSAEIKKDLEALRGVDAQGEPEK